MAVVAATFLSGCKFNDAQVKAIAQQTGLFAAVGWIAADNPTSDQIKAVKGIITLISTNADSVTGGKTYTEVLYPLLEQEIVTTLEPQYRPITRAGSFAILGAIDMMFAINPAWRADANRAIDVVKSFIAGCNMGFGLDDDHPAMVQARHTGWMRVQVLTAKPEGQ